MSATQSYAPCSQCGTVGLHVCGGAAFTVSLSTESQLDRIERKLDELALDVSTLRFQHETGDYERLTRAFDAQLGRNRRHA